MGLAPQRVVDAIDRHGPSIFKPQPIGRPRWLFQGAVYPAHALSDAISDCLGKHAARSIGSVAVGTVIPAVEWNKGSAQVFTSRPLGAAYASRATLHDVCMATAAAPTYFKPHELDGSAMLDGALVANNPDMMALVEVARRWPHRLQQTEMLSIGTAGSQPLRLTRHANRSQIGWASEMALFMIDAPEATAAHQASRLLGKRYLRVNHQPARGTRAFDRLDVADDAARTALLAAGAETATRAYRDQRAFIDRMLAQRP